MTILEGLAASGLRSVRYALEVAGVKSITANDISADAYKMIQRNIEHNNVQHIVKPSKEDAGLVCQHCCTCLATMSFYDIFLLC